MRERICAVFSRVHATLQPALSVRRLVGLSVGLSRFTFFYDFILWPHCSCPNGLVTSNMAPAHPHATSVAVYPALLKFCQSALIDPSSHISVTLLFLWFKLVSCLRRASCKVMLCQVICWFPWTKCAHFSRAFRPFFLAILRWKFRYRSCLNP